MIDKNPSFLVLVVKTKAMAHQTDNILNDDSSNGNPNANEFIDTVSLLVKKDIVTISKKTSDPKRAEKVKTEYLGSQIYQQKLIGRIWFMGRLLRLNVFPQEVHVIAKKTIYGYKWRETKVNERHIRIECRKIVQTRLDIAAFEMQKVVKTIRRKFNVVGKVVSVLKL